MLYEITTLPTRLSNGDLYVEYVGWETAADKARMTARGYQPQPGDVGVLLRHGPANGRMVYGQFANDHKQQIPDSGQRIKTVGTGRSMRLLLRDGTQVDPADRTPQTQQKIQQVGWDRETFSRFPSSETADNIEAWLSREQNRKVSRRRDRYGRPYARRDARGTTLNLQVAASADDAYSRNDGVFFDRTATFLRIWPAGGGQDAFSSGMRFAEVGVPAGATIDAANVSMQELNSFGDDVHAEFHAEDTDDSLDFVASADVTGRARTTASTVIAEDSVINWYSVNVTAAVAEVVARGGWSVNNAMTVLAIGTTAGTNLQFNIHSYDGNTLLAPKLDIDYTAAATAAGGHWGFQLFGRPF